MRRGSPVVVVTLGLLALLGSYVWYTQSAVTELERESRLTAELFSRVYAVATTPQKTGDASALFEVLSTLHEFHVPIIVTDAAGTPTQAADLPFDFNNDPSDPRVAAYVAELDRVNRPAGSGEQVVHFGQTQLTRGLRVIPLIQSSLIGILILVGALVLLARTRTERERVWAGMAREAAHQLGTPLSSLSGWVELLRESSADDPAVASALQHIGGDVERLERVAHRFERIGRPPRQDEIDVANIVGRVVDYFRARLPTLANAITIESTGTESGLKVAGDPVLLEWAVESLVKNAVDALAATGGRIAVEVTAVAGGGAQIRVADDGPGIPEANRSKIFAAGFSTKEGGWGIGLALARRIVQEAHGGTLALAPSSRGAAFDIILPG